MHLAPARLQHGAGEGADRALAVRAGDMDHRRHASFGMTERDEQPENSVQRQIDLLGVELEEPVENRVAPGVIHVALPVGGATRVGFAAITAREEGRVLGRVRFINRCTTRDSVSRN